MVGEEMKVLIGQLFQDMCKKMSEMNAEIKAEIGSVKKEMKAEMVGLKT